MTDRHQDRRRPRLTATVTDLDVVRQKAFLVGVTTKPDPAEDEASMAELARLVETAGSDPVGEEIQRRKRLEPATLIGTGKAAELAGLTTMLDVDVVVFDQALSPAQQRNLQQIFKCDVVDREAVILDIFAQHATSRAGMLQVELAQLRYRLPRLRGRGTELSRLGGGIGTRGPGETKLETDRRRILTRISKLEDELEVLAKRRATQRKSRNKSGLPAVALVGYTNAGKSTLLNTLTGSEVLVEDQLFSTLDSTVRRLDLPGGQSVVAADTVGFVRNLPHHLVEAFRSTLEEVTDADLLVHVVDASDPAANRQIEAVHSVLADIGAGSIAELMVLNKADAADATTLNRLRLLNPEAVVVSALSGDGVDDLLAAMAKAIAGSMVELDLLIPYDRGDVLSDLHRRGDVLTTDHGPNGTLVRARLLESESRHLQGFRTG